MEAGETIEFCLHYNKGEKGRQLYVANFLQPGRQAAGVHGNLLCAHYSKECKTEEIQTMRISSGMRHTYDKKE